MCKCTPSIKTPFCGKPGCEWPEQRPSKKCVLEIVPPSVTGGAWSIRTPMNDGTHFDLLYSQYPIEVAGTVIDTQKDKIKELEAKLREAQQLAVRQGNEIRKLERNRDALEAELKRFVAHAARGVQPPEPSHISDTEGMFRYFGAAPSVYGSYAGRPKEHARDVHYQLIEHFGLNDTPLANYAVRRMLETLAGVTATKESTLPRGCHRSHPHEDMDAGCERLTEIAREDNRRAHETNESRVPVVTFPKDFL